MRDQRLTKLSAVKPQTTEKPMSTGELVPSPHSVKVATEAQMQDPTTVMRGVTRSEIHPANAFPGTEAADISRVSALLTIHDGNETSTIGTCSMYIFCKRRNPQGGVKVAQTSKEEDRHAAPESPCQPDSPVERFSSVALRAVRPLRQWHSSLDEEERY